MSGIPVERIPQPVLDLLSPEHYQSVSTTTSHKNGNEQEFDDRQPRTYIIKLFGCGELSLEKEDKITEFSENYMIKKKYIQSYVQRLINLCNTTSIRQKEKRKLTKNMTGWNLSSSEEVTKISFLEKLKLTVPALIPTMKLRMMFLRMALFHWLCNETSRTLCCTFDFFQTYVNYGANNDNVFINSSLRVLKRTDILII